MRHLLFVSFVISAVTLSAQPKQNSPYSRYGIGDLLPQYFAAQSGMAGQTAAFHDPFHLNLVNPASYAHLRSTVLETGIYGKYSDYSSATASAKNVSGNLAYLALGFTLKSPINEILDKNKTPWQFGMGFALTPYSVVGYNIESQERRSDVGVLYNTFEGNGGLYRLNWSNAAKYKNTSVGVSLGWMLGKIAYENSTEFRQGIDTLDLTALQNNFRDEIRMHGFTYNIGVQQDLVLKYANKKDKSNPLEWITLGATAEGNHNLNMSADQLRIRNRGKLFNGSYSDPDTLLKVLGKEGTLTLPAAFSAGIQYTKANKLKIGAQFGYEGWSNYENDLRPETFRNTISVSGGLEVIPDFISYNKFMRRVRYRAGGYYRQDPRTVGNEKVNDVGLTLGMGLPLILPRQQTSFVNIALELGQLGGGTAIKENYARLTVGFTMNDNTWFYKRRFE